MSKTKSYRQQVESELRSSDQLYCCYCATPKNNYVCCGENHFVTFNDLYDEDQAGLIEDQLSEYEQWSDKQAFWSSCQEIHTRRSALAERGKSWDDYCQRKWARSAG